MRVLNANCFPESVNGEWQCPLPNTGVNLGDLLSIGVMLMMGGLVVVSLATWRNR